MADKMDRLIYLPLGGAGEIGMNAYVYGYGKPGAERLILVDLGVTFPDMDTTPGVDLIFPDMTWLIERKDRLEAIFVTHAHEDHVGGIAHFWERLGAPVYCRPFTGAVARRKMSEHGHPERSVKIVDPWPNQVQAGPFRVGFLPISHSIPESSGLVVDSAGGRIVHTGDFKLDETPVVGEAFDRALWSGVAETGVKALVCDSTNVFSPSAGRSELSVGPEIERLVSEAKGMVVATTFASNVARVKTLADAAARAGRSVCLMGRAMRQMIETAIETGVLKEFPKVVKPEDIGDLSRENVMLLATGSQGERRAATAQLARGKYQGISLKEGDLFLFSSKTIPGNERGVIRIINQLSEKGVDVVDDSSGLYHVSGHANRPDLAAMHEIVKPEMVIPMHGEHRHLRAHVALGAERGIPGAIAVNGTMLDLTGARPQPVEFVETGRVYLDGRLQIGALDGVVRDRIRMALNGLVVITVIIDEEGDALGDPWCEIEGLAAIGRSRVPLVDVLEEDLSQYIGRAGAKVLANDNKLEEGLRHAARRTALEEVGKRPEIKVIISRLE